MCQQENEGYVSRICAMCGAQDTEELGDSNTECLNCGFVFNSENSGVTCTDIMWEVDWFLGLVFEVQDERTEHIERALQQKMAVVSA